MCGLAASAFARSLALAKGVATEALAVRLEALLEWYAAPESEPALGETYERAMQLEFDFFDADLVYSNLGGSGPRSAMCDAKSDWNRNGSLAKLREAAREKMQKRAGKKRISALTASSISCWTFPSTLTAITVSMAKHTAATSAANRA